MWLIKSEEETIPEYPTCLYIFYNSNNLMRELEIKPETLESKIEKMERELLVIKLSLRKQKSKKIKLNQLVNKISSKAKPIETTSLIREMRNRNYG